MSRSSSRLSVTIKAGQSSKEPLHGQAAEKSDASIMDRIFGGDSDLSEIEEDGVPFSLNEVNNSSVLKDMDFDIATNSSTHDGDAEHPGPFTPRNTVLDDTHRHQTIRQSMIGSGIQRPLDATKIKTYSRRRVSREEEQSRTPSKAQVYILSSDSESSSLNLAISSPPKNGSNKRNQGKTTASKRQRDKEPHESPTPSLKRRRTITLDNNSSARRPSATPRSMIQTQSSLSPSSISVRRPRSDSLPTKAEKWSLETLGTLVWVCIGINNIPVGDGSKEAFWWPAKVSRIHSGKNVLDIQLFFPIDTEYKELGITLKDPSPLNILSYAKHKFDEKSFRTLPRTVSASAKCNINKLKTIKSRWNQAYVQILKEDEDLNDGFPSSAFALLSQTTIVNSADVLQTLSVSPKSKSKQYKKKIPQARLEEPNSSPLPDSSIRIPGELVLAKWRTSSDAYWPAKVLEYVEPKKPGCDATYLILYMDGWTEELTRNKFFIFEQEEFATCKLGEFESVETLHGNDELDDATEMFTTVDERLELPKLFDPTPPTSRFIKLPLLQQFAYIVPILHCALLADYKPCQDRITAFLMGGRTRQSLLKQVPRKGFLTRKEYGDLLRLVMRWAFGLESASSGVTQFTVSQGFGDLKESIKPSSLSTGADFQQSIEQPLPSKISTIEKTSSDQHEEDSTATFPPSSLPPVSIADDSPSCTPERVANEDHQVTIIDVDADIDKELTSATASAADDTPSVLPSFRDLPVHDKIHYCTDVLAHVAIIQILLWRNGERTTPQLLSDEEEQRLFDIGIELANQVDFAHEVQQLRETKVKMLETNSLPKLQSSSTNRGTRSRPKYD